LALVVGAAESARADAVWKLDDGNGWSVYAYIKDGKIASIHFYGPNNEYFGSKSFDSTPNPEGGRSSGGNARDALKAALELAKKYGGPLAVEQDAWKNLFGHTSSLNNKGPHVTDPWKGNPLFDEETGGGGSGKGFDPTVPLGEQLPSQPGKSDSDDGKSKRKPDPADAEDFEPDVIDPSPEKGRGLFLQKVATEGKPAEFHSGFSLLPTSAGPGSRAQTTSAHGSFILMGPLTSGSPGGSTKFMKTTTAGGLAGIRNLNPGNSLRSTQVGGAAAVRSANVTGGARSVTGLKLAK
jgi:hypothetical protein